MVVRDLLPGIPGGGSRAVYHECRQCGTNTDGHRESCPVCGGDVVEYEL